MSSRELICPKENSAVCHFEIGHVDMIYLGLIVLDLMILYAPPLWKLHKPINLDFSHS